MCTVLHGARRSGRCFRANTFSTPSVGFAEVWARCCPPAHLKRLMPVPGSVMAFSNRVSASAHLHARRSHVCRSGNGSQAEQQMGSTLGRRVAHAWMHSARSAPRTHLAAPVSLSPASLASCAVSGSSSGSAWPSAADRAATCGRRPCVDCARVLAWARRHVGCCARGAGGTRTQGARGLRGGGSGKEGVCAVALAAHAAAAEGGGGGARACKLSAQLPVPPTRSPASGSRRRRVGPVLLPLRVHVSWLAHTSAMAAAHQRGKASGAANAGLRVGVHLRLLLLMRPA